MFGKFEKDKKYVFSKDEFIKDQGMTTYQANKIWVDTCDKKLIEKITLHNHLGHINDKRVIKDWCKEYSVDNLVDLWSIKLRK